MYSFIPLSTGTSSWWELDVLIFPADHARFAYLHASRQSVLQVCFRQMLLSYKVFTWLGFKFYISSVANNMYSKSLSFSVLWSPEQQTWLQQCWAERKDHLPPHAVPNVVPNAEDSIIESWERSLQLTVTNNCAGVPWYWMSMLELFVF